MIIKRNKRYGVRIYRAGRQEWIGTFPTRREAREAERVELGRRRASRDETCDSFADRWVKDYPRDRASTNRHNGYSVKKFAADFQGTLMADVTRRRAKEWALRHRSNVGSVRAMFQDAQDEEIVTENPFTNLRLPQSRGRKDLVTITEERLFELADSALTTCDGYGSTFSSLHRVRCLCRPTAGRAVHAQAGRCGLCRQRGSDQDLAWEHRRGDVAEERQAAHGDLAATGR